MDCTCFIVHVLICVCVDRVCDDLELSVVCHRPEALDLLEAQSNFNRKELQVLYRGFKNVCKLTHTHTHTHTHVVKFTHISPFVSQECPSGVVNEETFKQIYSQFFPHGGQCVFAVHLSTSFMRFTSDGPEMN